MHTGLTVEPDDLYDDYTHEIHHRVGEVIHDKAYEAGIPAHWAAIKLIEGDADVAEHLHLSGREAAKIEQIAEEYEASSPWATGKPLIADSRYRFIEAVVQTSVKKVRQKGEKPGPTASTPWSPINSGLSQCFWPCWPLCSGSPSAPSAAG